MKLIKGTDILALGEAMGQLQAMADAMSGTPTNALIKAMAEAVGKNLAAYVEVMYPEAVQAASSTFRLSLRNHTYNTIMHVSTLRTEAEIQEWLKAEEAHRKEWLGAYRKMRKQQSTKRES